MNRYWIKLKGKISSRLTVENLGCLPNLTRALVSNLCLTGSLIQLKDGPGVTHSVPGTMAVQVK